MASRRSVGPIADPTLEGPDAHQAQEQVAADEGPVPQPQATKSRADEGDRASARHRGDLRATRPSGPASAAPVLRRHARGLVGHSTSPSAFVAPASRRGTSTRRLNSATEHAVLVEDAGMDADGAAVGLGARLLDLEHLGLAEQRVAVEDRRRVLELLGGEVGDRLAGDVGDAHAERERVDQRPDDDVAALLALARVDVVDVQRVVVHGDEAEQVVVGLGHGLGRPVLVDGADLELLEVAAVGMGSGRLAGGLVGFDGMGFGAHGARSWRTG